MAEPARFENFTEFYAFYLREHSKRGTRILHFIGTAGVIVFIVVAIATGRPILLLPGAVWAYGLAWVSHFTIEHNRPATFRHPLWSLAADFVLFAALLRGKEKFG